MRKAFLALWAKKSPERGRWAGGRENSIKLLRERLLFGEHSLAEERLGSITELGSNVELNTKKVTKEIKTTILFYLYQKHSLRWWDHSIKTHNQPFRGTAVKQWLAITEFLVYNINHFQKLQLECLLQLWSFRTVNAFTTGCICGLVNLKQKTKYFLR